MKVKVFPFGGEPFLFLWENDVIYFFLFDIFDCLFNLFTIFAPHLGYTLKYMKKTFVFSIFFLSLRCF